MQIQPTLNTIF